MSVTAWLCAVEGASQVWCWQELWHCWFCGAGHPSPAVLALGHSSASPASPSLQQGLSSPGAAGSHARQAAEGTLNTSLELAAWLLPEKNQAFTLESSAALHLKEVT